MKSPYTKPTTGNQQPIVISGGGFPWQTILIVLLLGWIVFTNSKNPPQPEPVNPDYIDDEDIVIPPDDPDDKKDDTAKVDLKDSYLVRVYETEADQQSPWMTKILNDDAFWLEYLNEKEMKYYTIDGNSNEDQAESFIKAAKEHDVSVPFIIHGKDGKVLSVMPFDESATTEAIKKQVLSKGK